MKSMSENSNTWLGFSLSPHMKMELSSHSHIEPSNSMLLQHFNTENGDLSSGFHHHPLLTVMPIKSDGSLCIMEALTNSQTQGMVVSSSSSPKLENFLGTTNMEKEAMSFDIFQNHNHSYYGDGDFFQEPKGITDMSDCNVQISEMFENGGPSLEVAGSMGCGELKSLTLSMSPNSQSNCITPTAQISPSPTDCLSMETKKRGFGKVGQKQTVHRKSIDTFGQRTSQYRGVTKHRWTGRYEAHLWDNSCKKEGQTRKGRQVYLGGYDKEEKAARAYDLAALKYWGPSTHTNFPLENYKDELEEMNNMTRQEYVAHLRRKSSGFSRGASMYRGVTRHHQHGRWQARIGRVAGNKDLYLGTFSTQEEAGEAYDIAAIKFRGINAVTNFDITRYNVEKIMSSNSLLAGEQAKKIKALVPIDHNSPPHIGNNSSDWKMVLSDYPCQQELNTNLENRGSNLSVSLHDLYGTDSLNSTVGENSSKMASVQFSSASSIVTSLNSSREGSPDKTGYPPNIAWMSPAQLRPPTNIQMNQLPVFAAWNDA